MGKKGLSLSLSLSTCVHSARFKKEPEAKRMNVRHREGKNEGAALVLWLQSAATLTGKHFSFFLFIPVSHASERGKKNGSHSFVLSFSLEEKRCLLHLFYALLPFCSSNNSTLLSLWTENENPLKEGNSCCVHYSDLFHQNAQRRQP